MKDSVTYLFQFFCIKLRAVLSNLKHENSLDTINFSEEILLIPLSKIQEIIWSAPSLFKIQPVSKNAWNIARQKENRQKPKQKQGQEFLFKFPKWGRNSVRRRKYLPKTKTTQIEILFSVHSLCHRNEGPVGRLLAE